MNTDAPTDLWCDAGGEGETTFLLLHGRGATGAVWTGLREIIERENAGRWLIPDLPGHGASPARPNYSYGQMAAEVATAAANAGPIIVIGHSLGGVISLALASTWFGLDICGVVAFGLKVDWTDAEVEGIANYASRPVRWFESNSEAEQRYSRVSGLEGLVPAGSPYLARGTSAGEGGYRLSQDPLANGRGAPPMAALMQAVQVPLVLAAGGADEMAPVEHILPFDTGAIEMPGLVHNAQVQDPEVIWGLVDRLG